MQPRKFLILQEFLLFCEIFYSPFDCKTLNRNLRCLTLGAEMLMQCCLQAVLEETHTRTVRSCAWSPNGKLLATASFDATTAIWENIGGDYECVSTLEVVLPIKYYMQTPYSLQDFILMIHKDGGICYFIALVLSNHQCI